MHTHAHTRTHTTHTCAHSHTHMFLVLLKVHHVHQIAMVTAPHPCSRSYRTGYYAIQPRFRHWQVKPSRSTACIRTYAVVIIVYIQFIQPQRVILLVKHCFHANRFKFVHFVQKVLESYHSTLHNIQQNTSCYDNIALVCFQFPHSQRHSCCCGIFSFIHQ